MNSPATPQASPSPALDSNRVQNISAADLIHDFYGASQKDGESELKDNNLFLKYISTVMINHLRPFGINVSTHTDTYGHTKYKLENASSIESKVLDFLNINEENSSHYIPVIDYTDFEIEYTAKVLNHLSQQDDIPFCFIVSDVTAHAFIHKLSLLCSIAFTNSPKIKFITDAGANLNTDTLCKTTMNKSNPIKGKVIVSEATYYDTGTKKDIKDCVMQRLIPVQLTKTGGNLFGLDKLSLKTEATQSELSKDNLLLDRMFIKYKHDKIHEEENILMESFITNQGKKSSESKHRNKNFFKDIISMITEPDDTSQHTTKRQRRGGGPKRPAGAMSSLLRTLQKVYHLDFEQFNNNITNIYQFMSILFDFKRAGDQLQIKSCQKNKCVFVSNDKVSIAYAYASKVPCIKTSLIGKKDDKTGHRKRKVIFYGFKKADIQSKLLNPDVMYKDYLLYHLDALLNLLPHQNMFTEQVMQDLQSRLGHKYKYPYTNLKLQKFKYPYLDLKLQEIIDKSYQLLNVTTHLDAKRGERSGVLNCEKEANRKYEYIYLLECNIFVCILLKYLLTTDYSDFNIDELRQNRLAVESSSVDANTMKNIVQKYDNDIRVSFAHYFKLDVQSIEFLLHVLKSYMTQDSDLLFEAINSMTFNQEYFDSYTSALRRILIPSDTDNMPKIFIVSDYINLIKMFSNRSKYRLTFQVDSILNTVPITCIFMDVEKATSKWIGIHNDIVQHFQDSFHFVDNLAKESMKYRGLPFETFSIHDTLIGGKKMYTKTHTHRFSERRSKSLSEKATISLIKTKNISNNISFQNMKFVNGIYANKVLLSMEDKLTHKDKTAYELFIEELEEEIEDIKNFDVEINVNDVELNEIYNTNDARLNKKLFMREFYKIIVVFLIKAFKVFHENGNISEKYQDIYRTINISSCSTMSASRSRLSFRHKSLSSSRIKTIITRRQNTKAKQATKSDLPPIREELLSRSRNAQRSRSTSSSTGKKLSSSRIKTIITRLKHLKAKQERSDLSPIEEELLSMQE